jgi:hypothetical protein
LFAVARAVERPGDLAFRVIPFQAIKAPDKGNRAARTNLFRHAFAQFRDSGAVSVTRLNKPSLTTSLTWMYSPPLTSVDITARAVGRGQVRLEVRDRGRGVPAADRERLGEAYFRASNSAGTPGTGLGLRVVRRAVETMGGRFGYAPPPGDEPGAVFWLEFPALDENQPATATAVARHSPRRSGKGGASAVAPTSTRKGGRST